MYSAVQRGIPEREAYQDLGQDRHQDRFAIVAGSYARGVKQV
jgi:hypothetical protein